MASIKYGDNIFEVGAVVNETLRRAGWGSAKIDGILAEISSGKSYDDAIAICRRYITIANED